MYPRLLKKPLSSRTSRRAVASATRYRWRSNVVLAAYMLVLMGALNGCEQREIVRSTPQMGVETQFWVRVLLLSDATECTIKAPAVVRVGKPALGPEISSVQAVLPADVPAQARLDGGQFTLGHIPLAGSRLVFSADEPYIFSLNDRDYRGRLELIANSDGRTFSAINLVPLEPYLAGVVGAEMPSYWEPEALKAQTIAARTYCLFIKKRFGVNRAWDVRSTQASQVYRGISAESAPVWNAVNATRGMVLTSGRRATLDSGLFPTYYSAICGGHTEDSTRVFGDSFPPLSGVACPYCEQVARLGQFFWPMVQYDRETVTRRLTERYPGLEALGQIIDIVVEDKSDHGDYARMTRVRLVGSTGKTDTLRGEDLRLTLDPTGRQFQSTICQIVPWGNGWAFLSGRGWGHGVGMCQNGAEGLARLGRNAREILAYYYPGAQIVNIY